MIVQDSGTPRWTPHPPPSLDTRYLVDWSQDRYEAAKGQVLGPDYHEIARRSDRVIGLSMLTLIYRSMAPEKPTRSAFCRECIDAARDTLQEHSRCVAVVTRAREKTMLLNACVSWLVASGLCMLSSTPCYV